MKTFFFTILFFVSCGTVYSQVSSLDFLLQDTVKHDADCYIDNFLGTWVSTLGNDVYELKFEKRIIYYRQIKKYTMEILGSIKKMRDNKVVYYQEIRDTNVMIRMAFPLSGKPISSKTLSLSYEEPGENKELGEVEFTLSNDKQSATWELRGTVDLKIINIQKYERFEIPYKMTFKRKQDKK